MPRVPLTLCMIVKDEEEYLEACLASVKGVVDEMIVVDTGSTDRTPEIAEAQGAKVIRHRWRDDFAAARNAGLERASGEWILVLDADEQLFEEDKAALRQLVTTPQSAAAFLINIYNRTDDGGQTISVYNRLFRNRPEYRFEDRVHEQVARSILAHGGKIARSSIRVWHSGYLSHVVVGRGKVERNLALLNRVAEGKKNDGFLRFNLGQEYMRSRQYEKALACFEQALALSPAAGYGAWAAERVAHCHLALGRVDQALDLLAAYGQQFRDHAAFPHTSGSIYLQQRRLHDALAAFWQAIALGAVPERYAIRTAGLGTFQTWYELGRAYEAGGLPAKACNAYLKCLRENRQHKGAAVQLMQVLLQESEPAEAILALLQREIDLQAPTVADACWEAFLRYGKVEQAAAVLRSLPESSRSPWREGVMLSYQRSYNEALRHLETIVASDERYPVGLVESALCYMLLEDWPAAAWRLRQAKEYPANRPAVCVLAALAEALGGSTGVDSAPPPGQAYDLETQTWRVLDRLVVSQEFERFERGLKLVDRFGFDPGRSKLNLSKVLHRHGFLDLALESLVAAAQAGVQDIWLFRTLGAGLARRGEPAEARPLFDAAINLDPDEPALYATCADELAQAGDPLGAQGILVKARQRWPESTEIARRLNALTASA